MTTGVTDSDRVQRGVSRPQARRLRRLLEMIRAGTRSGRYPNAGDFCDELEVSRRTVLRDLDCLRDDERAPIDYDGRRKGYFLTDVTWQLAPVELTRQELFSFAVARKLLAAFQGTPLEVDMKSVLSKIARALDGHVTLDLESLTDRFSVISDDYAVQDPRLWNALSGHIERQEQVEMRYEKFNGQRATYLLSPYHLLAYHGDWYVMGGTTSRAGVVTFAVSRIESLAATGTHFSRPAGFDAGRHVAKAFGVMGGERELKVRLRFSPAVAGYIRHRVWHPSQQLHERRGGGVDLTLRTTGWKALVRWVLSWQPDVTVLAPVALRVRVEEKLGRVTSGEGRGEDRITGPQGVG